PTATNVCGYRPEDHGNTTATATPLVISGTVYSASGVISQIGVDSDFFAFVATSGGNTTIRAEVDDYLNDLNAVVRLYDASGNLLATANPSNSFDAQLVASLANGVYFVEVASAGGNGEAGQYTLTITVPTPPPPPPPPPSGG